MGGSDTAKNRCFEPHTGKFSLLAKNEAELLLWRNVCVNKTMTLDQVKKTYLRGWTKLLVPTLKTLARFIEGTPKVQTSDVVNSTFHKIAVHGAA